MEMIYQKIGIRTTYIEEEIISNTSIVTVFVLWSSHFEAEYMLKRDEQSQDKYYVVKDIYRFYQKDDEILRKDSYEIYYEAKKNKDDLFHVKSIKFFSSKERGFRTDWYCNNVKKLTYRTYETGSNHDFDYRKFEYNDFCNSFVSDNIVYNGVLSDVQLGDELLNKINDINFDYNNRKNETYNNQYVNEKVKLKTLSF